MQQNKLNPLDEAVSDPVLDHHYNNIKEGKTIKGKDGYLSTVVTIQVENKAEDTNIRVISGMFTAKLVFV